jgi:hypothetical protein
MPKRTSKRLDTVQNARRIVLESVGATEPASQPPEPEKPSKSLISQVMAEMGRKGGQIGGKRRLETMTAKERRAVALQGAKARWAKKKKKPAA